MRGMQYSVSAVVIICQAVIGVGLAMNGKVVPLA